MKPAWDQLMAEYSGSKHAGVYDVDCTADGKALCEDVGVSGYPTIKYGDPSDKKDLQTYSGGRDFDALKKFAEDNLSPTCGPASMDACSDEEKVLLASFMTRSSADLLAEATKLEKDFAATQFKLDRKASKLKDKERDYQDDAEEQRGSKPKKGKEAEHKAKMDKLDARKAKIEEDKEALKKEQEALMTEMAKSGLKLMKLVSGIKLMTEGKEL